MSNLVGVLEIVSIVTLVAVVVAIVVTVVTVMEGVLLVAGLATIIASCSGCSSCSSIGSSFVAITLRVRVLVAVMATTTVDRGLCSFCYKCFCVEIGVLSYRCTFFMSMKSISFQGVLCENNCWQFPHQRQLSLHLTNMPDEMTAFTLHKLWALNIW